MSEGGLELSDPLVVDASGVMQILRRDHQRLGVVLERVEGELGSRNKLDGLSFDPQRRQRLLAMLSFLHEYADRVHHPLESRLFDRLIEKGLTPLERRVVFVTMSQHEEILGDLLSLQEALRSLPEHRQSPVGEGLQARAQRYLDGQKRHLHFEDSQLLPLICARLTAEDWCDMERELSVQISILREVCEADLLPVFRAILDPA